MLEFSPKKVEVKAKKVSRKYQKVIVKLENKCNLQLHASKLICETRLALG